jgi:hypothetical protein
MKAWTIRPTHPLPLVTRCCLATTPDLIGAGRTHHLLSRSPVLGYMNSFPELAGLSPTVVRNPKGTPIVRHPPTSRGVIRAPPSLTRCEHGNREGHARFQLSATGLDAGYVVAFDEECHWQSVKRETPQLRCLDNQHSVPTNPVQESEGASLSRWLSLTGPTSQEGTRESECHDLPQSPGHRPAC